MRCAPRRCRNAQDEATSVRQEASGAVHRAPARSWVFLTSGVLQHPDSGGTPRSELPATTRPPSRRDDGREAE